ncbi:hypothetical protein HMN09_01122600 [Mycena chlorophos]|uniref:BTB domain-containing protein n=1 Tax=Mycena chlorophos TaxID=658473 RepID=A0A8H6SCG8_MYCCL|nr:hypothetical protein HMN09_01122600 [Mycena chlorophos]
MSAPSTESNGYERHPELWFADGTIILRAENTQYRVYRGILERYSPNLKAALENAPERKPVAVCPVFDLNDSVLDSTPFLLALFSPEFLPSKITQWNHLCQVRGCLRLAHKYQVNYFRRKTLSLLTLEYPLTLEARDEIDLFAGWRSEDHGVHKLYMLALAREVGALWLLPTILHDIYLILTELGFGELDQLSDFGHFSPTTIAADDAKAIVTNMGDHFHGAVQILSFLGSPAHIKGCTTPDCCPLLRFQNIGYAMTAIEIMRDRPLDVWSKTDWKRLNLCQTCLKTLKKNHQSARQDFWNKLPGRYGLPGWKELKEMAAAAGVDAK